MTKENKYQLTEDELEIIREAVKNDKRIEVVKRASALRLLHEGQHVEVVADMMGVGVSSVYNWRKRWQEGQLEALVNRPISGRPSQATEAYWQALDEVLERNPQDLGYIFSIWTTERLAQHLAEVTGIQLSSERLRVLMKQQGYVYRRPKADLAIQQDAQAREAAQQALDELKKKPSQGILSYSLWTKARSI